MTNQAEVGILINKNIQLSTEKGNLMNTTTTQQENDFIVVGITLRTTNKEAFETGTIQKLWQQFFTQQIFDTIPNKINNDIIALYYDFESDKDGQYTLLLGTKVSSIDLIPTGLSAQHVPAENRKIFTSEQGPIIDVVIKLWQNIWNLEDQKKLHRAYQFDYELYDQRSHNPEQAQVAIHIGLV